MSLDYRFPVEHILFAVDGLDFQFERRLPYISTYI